MEDLAARLDAHDCNTIGQCARGAHTQPVLVSPEDVVTTAAEIGLLGGVRDLLIARGLSMLETEPTPRFDPGDTEPRPWRVRYTQAWASGARSSARGSGGWLSRLLER